MSFSSLEAGHATSAGAADYPLRTLARDLREREVQRELDAALDRTAEGQAGPPDRADDDFEGWLRSDDSPLLLHNVEEFVHDPEAHLRALAERVEGPGRAQHYSGAELVGGPSRGNTRDRAEELRARLRTMAELDAERILAVPRRRGTPRGKTRAFYMWLVSPDRNISNADFKRLVLEIICPRWPGAVVAGYIHRDTDNTHFHLWLSAETLSGKKISVTRMRLSGDVILDKYPDLDEEVARSVSRHFGDPSIYDDHIARKLEWVHWRERFEESLRRGARPPVMPHRARHDYDWVGERRAVADRERGEKGPHSGEREKAVPAPRAKSLMGALELWGKTVHLEARVGYRRELLASLDGWGPLLIDHPVEALREHFTRELARAERECERHRIAFEKTLENRALLGYEELRHPLHNSRQIAAMKQIAELTHDAELLRHVHSYLILDRPGPAETTLSQAIGERWGEQIGARLGVYERARLLQDVAEANRQLREESRAGYIPPVARMRGLDPDQEIVRGWLGGGWTRRQMEDSAGLIADAGTSYHAGRYLKACDYLAAANEVLGQYRRGAEATTAYPVLDQAQRHRLDALARDGASGLGNAGALWLKEVAAVMDLEEPPGRAKFLRLMERSLEINRDYELPSQRDGGQGAELGTLKPHDERWMSRLVSVTELKEAEALAVAMRGATEEDFRNCEARAREMRARLELATVIRAAGGAGDLPQGRDLTRVEGRELDNHHSYIAQRLAAPRPDWSRAQVDWIKGLGHVAPPSMQDSLTRSLARAELQLEQAQRSEDIELLDAHLHTAAQFFARSLHRSEGAASLSDSRRFAGHVEALTDRYLQVVEDGGRRPEQLGLDRARLGAHARGELLAELTRLDREERDLTELARLEARVILANALRDASTAERERFENHAFFYRWRYHTTDGREYMSLAEARAVIGEWFDASGTLISPENVLLGGAGQTGGLDPARMLVATEAEPHLATAIDKQHTRLLASEQIRAEEADVLNHEYAEMSARRGGNTRGPIFMAEELLRLEECASVTRNVQMVEVIGRSEEALYGAEYATRRSLGRTIAASLAEQRERALDGQYEKPLRLESHPRLAPPVHEQLSERLARHHAAREWERDSSAAYHAAWRARSEEQVGELSRAGRTVPPRPLLSHREAEDVYASLSASQRAAFDRILRNVEVMDKPGPGLESPDVERRYPTIHEWNAKNFGGQAYLRHEYVKGLGDDVRVSSHEQAERQIKRSQSREGHGRGRT